MRACTLLNDDVLQKDTLSDQGVAEVLTTLALQVRETFTAWLRQYVARLRQESWQTPGAAERRVNLMQSCNPR